MRKLMAALVVACAAGGWVTAPQNVQLPVAPGSLKFAVIGDNGTGDTPQYEVAKQMTIAQTRFPFEFVIMLGDNLYGRQQPQDFVDKFERPYAPLLEAGISFYATLGNHDNQANRFYRGFNMEAERYYTFARKNVRFFVFDTNLMDPTQVAWIEDTLKQSPDDQWKISYFHHPIYSDGERHGSNIELRVVLEPLLVRYGVDVVFSGHEHIYERIRPQKGITYFVDGSGGQLRKGGMRPSEMTAASFDQDQTFMLVEIAGDDLSFQAIARTGRLVDSGVIHRRPTN
jgi:predicted phosphodiesterase